MVNSAPLNPQPRSKPQAEFWALLLAWVLHKLLGCLQQERIILDCFIREKKNCLEDSRDLRGKCEESVLRFH